MFNRTMIAAAAAGLLATGAAAESYFTYIDEAPMESSTQIMLGDVVADAPGEVVIYDYNTDEFGEVLGSVEISEGANNDVDVQLTRPPINDIAAVLYLGEPTTPDEAADWVQIDIEEMDEE